MFDATNIDEASAAHLLRETERIGAALVETLSAALCEAVIHDFRRGDESIAWIAGTVTQRHTGGSMSRIGVTMRSEGDAASDRVNYLTRTSHGKVIKSTTTVLRDINGRSFGLFCVNLDMTALSALEATLKGLLHGTESKVLTNVHFGNSVADVAQAMLADVAAERGLRAPPTAIPDRIAFVRALDQQGFFGIRYAVQLLADYLGVSRAAIYNYLKASGRAAGPQP